MVGARIPLLFVLGENHVSFRLQLFAIFKNLSALYTFANRSFAVKRVRRTALYHTRPLTIAFDWPCKKCTLYISVATP